MQEGTTLSLPEHMSMPVWIDGEDMAAPFRSSLGPSSPYWTPCIHRGFTSITIYHVSQTTIPGQVLWTRTVVNNKELIYYNPGVKSYGALAGTLNSKRIHQNMHASVSALPYPAGPL